jgi:hypothetical protein
LSNFSNKGFVKLNKLILRLLEDFSMLFYEFIDATSIESLNEFLTSILDFYD